MVSSSELASQDDMLSPAQILAALTPEEREEQIAKMSPKLQAELRWNWHFWARPNQLEPLGTWTTWLILAGRGFGKTRVGAETIRSWVCGDTPLSKGRYSRIALVAETAADARDVMVEGESGLLGIHPKGWMPNYEKTNRRVTWPNGAVAYLYNATEPDQLRGPQHDAAWIDELAKFRYIQETWDQLQFGLRLGDHPRQIVTTTPRPLGLIRKLMVDEDTVVTRGRTFDNSDNLARPFLRQIEDRYGGTRLGRQELEGEILDDVPGALWNRSIIDGSRVKEAPAGLDRVIVAVDPAASSGENADETGIIGVGTAPNADGYTEGYVLADRSLRGTPEEWARAAVNLYRELQADRIVAEKNNGGEMVEAVIRSVDRTIPITLVHASRGKYIRAEPVSALYEQGRIHHAGRFDKLEDQMCTFSHDIARDREGSPDRVDALVWGLSQLFGKITSRRKKAQTPDKPVTLLERKTGSKNITSDTAWMI